jgi:hypothetical protein
MTENGDTTSAGWELPNPLASIAEKTATKFGTGINILHWC